MRVARYTHKRMFQWSHVGQSPTNLLKSIIPMEESLGRTFFILKLAMIF